MTRTSFRPVAAVGLVAAILTYVGCARTYETTDARPGPAPRAGDGPAPPAPKAAGPGEAQVPKLIAEWSKAPPAGILVISGEQFGYLQPCGCTDGQLGGLGRRYDLVAGLRARGWPVALIDLGSLVYKPASARGGVEQEKIKFDTALKALAAMKYDAVALGAEDLKFGVFQTLGVLLNYKGPKFLAANARPTKDFEATLRPTTLAQAGPIAIGIASVIDPASFEALHDPDAALLTVTPPDAAIPGVLAELAGKSQVRVLMVQGPPEEGRRLAEKFPGFDLVVSRSKFADPDARPESLHGGKTLLINVGQKGKYVGVVGIYPGPTPRLDYRLQPLDREFREAEPIRALVDDEMQAVLRAVGVVENASRRTNGSALPGATYIGAQACQSCHPKTFAKWSSTKHARAYEALLNPKRNREHDAECISCHTTGFPYDSGWVSAEQTPNLKGNQCENCHGPASLHAAEPDNLTFRKPPMAMTAEAADRNNFCTNCHDEDNDHDFKFASRYAQIFHKGLDNYDDPKVHLPQPPKVAAEGR